MDKLALRPLYPELKARETTQLTVGTRHRLYVEESGVADGVPIVLLHGGPGSASRPYHRRFFDPQAYRTIVFDQRGVGQSVPHGDVDENTTQDLIADLESIRTHLGIERWLLFGGSWGATLALAYAETYPTRVLGMILRGTFLAREEDLRWFLGGGSARVFPDAWETFVKAVGADSVDEIVSGCYQHLISDDAEQAKRIAKAWADWSTWVAGYGMENPPTTVNCALSDSNVAEARLETHYAYHRYFLEPNQLLRDADRLADIPMTIVHGRRDLMCAYEAAWALHRALPHSKLVTLPRTGHLATETAMVDALVRATDEFSELIHV
jgi:proline iminopeptidase